MPQEPGANVHVLFTKRKPHGKFWNLTLTLVQRCPSRSWWLNHQALGGSWLSPVMCDGRHYSKFKYRSPGWCVILLLGNHFPPRASKYATVPGVTHHWSSRGAPPYQCLMWSCNTHSVFYNMVCTDGTRHRTEIFWSESLVHFLLLKVVLYKFITNKTVNKLSVWLKFYYHLKCDKVVDKIVAYNKLLMMMLPTRL